MDNYDNIIFEIKNGVGRIFMNTPKNLNALSVPMAEELSDALSRCDEDESLRVVVIGGIGKAFSAGGDFEFFNEQLKKEPFTLEPIVLLLENLIIQIKRLSKPVIAAVNGAAAGGGCNLALACDMVIASEKAKFIQSFVNIGLTPDTGGGFFLPRLIGDKRAFELFATGRAVKAEEALNIGMINRVFSSEKFDEEAEVFVESFAAGPAKAYEGIKKIMYRSVFYELEDFVLKERETINAACLTYDAIEGINAFLENRAPNFQGK